MGICDWRSASRGARLQVFKLVFRDCSELFVIRCILLLFVVASAWVWDWGIGFGIGFRLYNIGLGVGRRIGIGLVWFGWIGLDLVGLGNEIQVIQLCCIKRREMGDLALIFATASYTSNRGIFVWYSLRLCVVSY